MVLVLRSEHPDFKVGEHYRGLFRKHTTSKFSTHHYGRLYSNVVINAAHQQYAVVKITPDLFIRKIENPNNLPWSLFLGVLGMPGSWLSVIESGILRLIITCRTNGVHRLEGVLAG